MRLKKYIQFISEGKLQVEMPLPDDIIKIASAYTNADKDIFIVGGAVRDFIQGKEPKDYDLVTNALPDESKAILKGFNVSDEQGKNFGVIRVYTKDEPAGYEIASYRKDISGGRDTKGDDQKVEMGSHVTIEDDCNRRDLTINSLFYDINKKEIVDLTGGIEDIKNGIIRAVGNPNERFIEDRLRICRVFRFAARTGGEIDRSTSDAIKADNRLKGVGPKDDVSQERIWEEFKKAWAQSKDYRVYLDFYSQYNMWDQIFPGVNINKNLIKSDSFIINIANLFKNESITGLSNKMIQDFKIESDIVNKVIFLLSLYNFSVDNVLDFYKKKIQCGIDNSTIKEWLIIQDIDNNLLNKFIKWKPSVSAVDLMNKGFKGVELGVEIKRLEVINFKSTL